MRRTDSGSGDTGSLEHVGRAGTGALDGTERAGDLAHARLSLGKEGPADDGSAPAGRHEGRGDDATDGGGGDGHEKDGGGHGAGREEGGGRDGAGVLHARVPDGGIEGGPDTGRERPSRARDEKNADL